MAEHPPDLKVLLTELARAVNEYHPGTFTQQEIDRVLNAINPFLVVSRVLASAGRRASVFTAEQIVAATIEAKRAAATPQGELFEAVPLDQKPKESTRITDWEITSLVDRTLVLHGKSMPEWFTDDFWPGCLRRLAQNQPLTDRQRGIAMHVASIAIGER